MQAVEKTRNGWKNGTGLILIKMKILMGVTLFSMVFGAGNLIFPPFWEPRQELPDGRLWPALRSARWDCRFSA